MYWSMPGVRCIIIVAHFIQPSSNLTGKIMQCREEAEQLLGREVAASQAALELGSMCSVAAITDGPNGSYISALGRLQVRYCGCTFGFKRSAMLCR